MRLHLVGVLSTGHHLTTDKMRKTKNILTVELTMSVVITLAVIILFENGLITPGVYAADHNMCFVAVMIMELVTICFIPFALYMFKLAPVRLRLLKAARKSLTPTCCCGEV